MFLKLRKFNLATLFIITVFACALCGSACQSKAKTAEIAQPEEQIATNGALQANIDSMAAELEALKQPKDSLLIYFEKTYCFGRCPVFKIHVYDSGFTTYEGVNFVDHMGLFSAHTERETIDMILAEANKIDFFNLQDSYDLEGLQDVPSTIVSIRNDGITKRVVARYSVPKSLTTFLGFVNDSLTANTWVSYPIGTKK